MDIGTSTLTLELFADVVARRTQCTFGAPALARVEAAHRVIAEAAAGAAAVYGINTGFGDLASVRIAPEKLATLQERLILSHAAGVGEPLADAAVRGMLLLRAHTLARGHSG